MRSPRPWRRCGAARDAAPLSAAAGLAALEEIATGEPIPRANELAAKLRAAWDQVLARHGKKVPQSNAAAARVRAASQKLSDFSVSAGVTSSGMPG